MIPEPGSLKRAAILLALLLGLIILAIRIGEPMAETKEEEKRVPQEYPRLLYKVVPVPPDPPPPGKPTERLETLVVNDDAEEKKAEGQGWSKDPPQEKADKQANGGKHEEGKGGFFRHDDKKK